MPTRFVDLPLAASTARSGPSSAGRGEPAAVVGPRRRMRPPVRRLVLVLHVAVSVGAIGIYLGLLSLAVAGLTTQDRATLQAAYVSMGIVAEFLIIPVSLAIVVTGLVLGLGTKWGLLRHYWVLTKLLLTLGLAAASIFGLRARIADAIGSAADGALDAIRLQGTVLVVLLLVALAIYATTTVLSIYKPWGKTRRGRRP